jgi:hypothetical protein
MQSASRWWFTDDTKVKNNFETSAEKARLRKNENTSSREWQFQVFINFDLGSNGERQLLQ